MVYGLVPGVLEALRDEIDREHVISEPEIDVTVEDGIVTLTGRVESPATKEIMSRWNKDDIVRTDKDGFVVLAIPELERLAAG
jgi:hypothetical protein